MDKLVYLFELDSVRNQEAEIKKAQKALFEEIVLNGNKVVLSFNQLTDSRAFLNLLEYKDTYDYIMELFKFGVIKISMFGSCRTPSQYIQNSLDKCISGESTFIFSGIPVKSDDDIELLIKPIKEALQYSDVTRMSEVFKNHKDKYDENKINFIEKYIEMILLVSREKIAHNPPKLTDKHSYEYYMDLILNKSYNVMKNTENDSAFLKNYSDAVELLKKIYQLLKTTKTTGNRSNWLKELSGYGKDKDVCIANAIIDLCYNYTIEDSIYSISKHYDDKNENGFLLAFCNRLLDYCNDSIHVFPTKDENSEIQHVKSDLPWNTAVNVIKNVRKKEIENFETHNISDNENQPTNEPDLYEKDYDNEIKLWNKEIVFSIIKEFGVTFLYIFLFFVIELIMGAIENFVADTHILDGLLFDIIFSITIFGIIGSIISDKTNIPDLLESFKNIKQSICDIVNLRKSERNIAYINKGENNV